MKKVIALFLALLMMLGVLASCTQSSANNEDENAKKETEEKTETEDSSEDESHSDAEHDHKDHQDDSQQNDGNQDDGTQDDGNQDDANQGDEGQSGSQEGGAQEPGEGSGQESVCSHTGGTATCIEKAICSLCNTPYGSTDPTKHPDAAKLLCVLNSDDNTKHDRKYDCCGSVVATESHVYNKQISSFIENCTQNGYDLVECDCGDRKTVETGVAVGHEIFAWALYSETAKADTDCTFTQTWKGFCFACRQDVTREIEVVRHTYVASVTRYPTCVEEGEKTYKCSTCDATPEGANTFEIPAIPHAHNWGNGETSGNVTTYTCQNQGCTKTRTSIVSDSSTQTLAPSLLASNDIVLNNNITLDFDDTLCSNLSQGTGDITVTASLITENRDSVLGALSEDIRNAIGNDTPIINFNLEQNSGNVAFNNGTIQITVPYTLPTGADPECVAIWYVAWDEDAGEYTTAKPYEATYYELNGQGYITFTAEHFSVYLPGITTPADACTLYEHNFDTRVVAPTCTSRGYTEKNCQRCGYSEISDVVNAIGHMLTQEDVVNPTCKTSGSRTDICDREECGYVRSYILPPINHPCTKDNTRSTNPTCTEDGLTIYSCTTPGCDYYYTYEVNPAYGHSTGRNTRGALAAGATSCTGGVIVYADCTREGCDYAKETYYYDHINIYDPEIIPDHKGVENPAEPIKVTLGAKLTEAGFNWNPQGNKQEPYLELKLKCLCGEEKTSAYLVDESHVFLSSEARYKVSGNQNGISFTKGGKTLTFISKSVKQVCDVKYYLYVYFNDYNQNDPTAGNPMEIFLSQSKVHNREPRASVVELKNPSEPCYAALNYAIESYKCLDCGEICYTSKCGTLGYEKHYFLESSDNYEIYERDGFKFYIQTCICNAEAKHCSTELKFGIQYAGVSFNYDSNSSDRVYRTIDNGTEKEVHSGYYYVYKKEGDNPFMWAEEEITVYDHLTCQAYRKIIAYLDCNENDYKDCKKSFVCEVGIPYKDCLSTPKERIEIPIEGTECCVKEKVVCTGCGAVTYGIKYKHTVIENSATDSDGNRTEIKFCDSCPYTYIERYDRNDKTIYKREEKYATVGSNICWNVSINNWVETLGSERELLYRYETYEDESKQNCTSWREKTYKRELVSGEMEGCVMQDFFVYADSSGYYREEPYYVESCCEFRLVERTEANCVIGVVEKYACTRCGFERMWIAQANHTYEYEKVLDTNGNGIPFYRCSKCGICKQNDESFPPRVINLMLTGVNGDVITVEYLNEIVPSFTNACRDYGFVAFFSETVVEEEEESTRVKVDQNNQIIQESIAGIELTNTVFEGWDNRGTLTFSKQALLEGISELDETPSGVYLMVQDIEGHVLYVDLSYVLGLKTAA